MAKEDIDEFFKRIDSFIEEVEQFVPNSKIGSASFRADLAGLFCVLIAATYENCVKDVVLRYADARHQDFSEFTKNNFSRLNSNIRINDLCKYAKNFGPTTENRFKSKLEYKNNTFKRLIGLKIKEEYENLLTWRHTFAHEGKRITTIEEIIRTHKCAKHIIYAFDFAFA